MTPEVNFVVSTSTLVAAIAAIWRLASRIATNEVKVNTLWDYHMRRSIMAGINNDTLKVNSPLRVTSKGEEWFHDLLPELKKWYQSTAVQKLSDRDLFVAIEQNFGKRITTEVALPHNVHPGEAVAVAVALLRAVRMP